MGFLSFSAEEVDVLYVWLLIELFYYLLHEMEWIDFSFVCREGCNSDVDGLCLRGRIGLL